MTIIRKGNHVANPLYEDIIEVSGEEPLGGDNHCFKYDGVFLSKEEAVNIWKALTKKPMECDSEDEYFAIMASVQLLRRILASIEYDAVKQNLNDVKSEIPTNT